MTKREPIAQQLLTTPLPIDRVARRVTNKAKPEHLWQPLPKPVERIAHSRTVIATCEPPTAMPCTQLARIIGGKRGRLTVVGYAAEQGTAQLTKWVVRCDCGNYEIRTRILRWLGTEADDMCSECRNRRHKIKQGEEHWSREPAKRKTKGN